MIQYEADREPDQARKQVISRAWGFLPVASKRAIFEFERLDHFAGSQSIIIRKISRYHLADIGFCLILVL
jgi:hypothetical protein